MTNSTKPNLMSLDYCQNGHDIRNKAEMIVIRYLKDKKGGKRVSHACRQCLTISQDIYRLKKGHKPRKHEPRPIAEIKSNLLDLIENATEPELLKMYLSAVKIVKK